MRIVVTGGAGFIGSNLVDHLDGGRSRSRRDRQLLDRAGEVPERTALRRGWSRWICWTSRPDLRRLLVGARGRGPPRRQCRRPVRLGAPRVGPRAEPRSPRSTSAEAMRQRRRPAPPVLVDRLGLRRGPRRSRRPRTARSLSRRRSTAPRRRPPRASSRPMPRAADLRRHRLPLRVHPRPSLHPRPRRDFLGKLRRDPTASRSSETAPSARATCDVEDCVAAVAPGSRPATASRSSTWASTTTAPCRESAGWICERLGSRPELEFTGGDRGWVGDNPFIWLDTSRIRATGWAPRLRHPASLGRAHRRLPGRATRGCSTSTSPLSPRRRLGTAPSRHRWLRARRGQARRGLPPRPELVARTIPTRRGPRRCAMRAPHASGSLAIAPAGAAAAPRAGRPRRSWRRTHDVAGCAAALAAASTQGCHVLSRSLAHATPDDLARVAARSRRREVGRARRLQPPLPPSLLARSATVGDAGSVRRGPASSGAATATAAGSATSASGAPTPARSGGGELLDQGVHLIDLAHHSRRAVDAPLRRRSSTLFWPMAVEDNAFVHLGLAGDGATPGCMRRGPSGRTCSRSRSTCRTRQARDHRARRQLRPRAAHASTRCPSSSARRWRRRGSGLPATDSWAAELVDVARRDRRPAGGRRRPSPTGCRVLGDRRTRRTTDDHHPHPVAHLARRRWNRPARRTTERATVGFLVAAAITKYVYVAVHPNFGSHVLLKYSSIENVPSTADVEHPLLREALLYTGIEAASRSRRWPTSRPAPASAPRARSPSACSKRSTPTSVAS